MDWIIPRFFIVSRRGSTGFDGLDSIVLIKVRRIEFAKVWLGMGILPGQRGQKNYHPITMFDSITLREWSRSEPVFCM
jgi:hypothetical protein